jgi:dTDP-4-dehydrorhamnose 3,5-epimerase
MREPTIRAARLRDVLVLEPDVARDERGFFVRTLDASTLRAAGLEPSKFVQENQSRSRAGTLRGLHGRTELSEAKLVRCARGSVYDVVVDVRPWSETFGEWESFVLDDEAHRQVYVPAGCLHGFLAVSESADVCYRHDAVHDPAVELAVRWDDDELGIDWPGAGAPLVSARDRDAVRMHDIRDQLEEWYGSQPPEASEATDG